MFRITNVPIYFARKDFLRIERSFSCCNVLLDKMLQRTEPVKLAYASYECVTDTDNSNKLPIMIMHGLFGSKSNWNSLAKAIHNKTERKVIVVDARNHGDSPHSTQMSYGHMCSDIITLLYDLGLKKCILIGHSMGGSAMMYTALTYPQVVDKLVVVDMSPVGPSPSLNNMVKIFDAMRSISFEGSTSLSKARKSAEEHLTTHIKIPELCQFLTMNVIEAEPGKYRWRVNLPVLERCFPKITNFPNVEGKVFPGPTLFIGGANSDYIKPDHHGAIKKLFPDVRIEYIAGANHWVHSDKPTEFLNLVTNFINL